MGQWWNGIDRGKTDVLGENTSLYHCVYHIPSGLALGAARISAVRGGPLTA